MEDGVTERTEKTSLTQQMAKHLIVVKTGNTSGHSIDRSLMIKVERGEKIAANEPMTCKMTGSE